AGAVTNAAAPAATPITPARPVAGGAKSGGPAIDGLLIRGLYLWNARQQEVVVDYFKNLVGSPFFTIDPTNQQRVIKPTMPNNNEWAFPYELQLDLKQPLPLPCTGFAKIRFGARFSPLQVALFFSPRVCFVGRKAATKMRWRNIENLPRNRPVWKTVTRIQARRTWAK